MSKPATDALGAAPATGLANLEQWCVAATRRIAAIGVAGIIAVAFLTVGDVLSRWLFHWSVVGLGEITALFLAVSIAACLPAGLAMRVSLVFDFAEKQLPRHVVVWLQAAGAALLAVLVGVLCWRLSVVAAQYGAGGQTTMFLQWPVAPFVWAIVVVLALGLVVQIVITAVACQGALKATPRSGWLVLLCGAAGAGLLCAGLAGAIDGRAIGALIGQEPIRLALIFFALMWVAMMLLVPLGAAMGLTGIFGTAMVLGLDPALSVAGSEAIKYLTSSGLSVLPLFLLMGALASVAGLSADIYRLAQALVGHIRGGLAHATVIGCAGFGALTGSSLATAATIGRVALPEMRDRGYSPALATGSIAAGGTLGQLIPPSTVIIVFALLTEESIGRLFIAALVPALITIAVYLVAISAYVRMAPAAAPAGERASWSEIGALLTRCWGVIALFGAVVGGLYTGLFTETEAASVGAFGSFMFALFRGKLTRERLWEVMAEATSTIALIYVLILGAVTFSFFIGVTRLPDIFLDMIGSANVTPVAVILILVGVYLVLGMVMDSFAIMVITVPIFTPLVIALGYDPVWWGIITVVCVEMGMITPPFGLNLFVIKAVAPDVPLGTVYRGVMPFVGADLVKLAILIAFPILILWLPQSMF